MKHLKGFTLTEVLIAVAIFGILVAIGVPNYRDFVLNNCLSTGASAIVTSIHQARSEAIKRRTDIHLTAFQTTAGNEWGTGWRIWRDTNANDVYNAGTDEEIRVTNLSCDTTTINETGNTSDFEYNSRGVVSTGGTFDICDSRDDETGRQITLSGMGRPSTNASYAGCNP